MNLDSRQLRRWAAIIFPVIAFAQTLCSPSAAQAEIIVETAWQSFQLEGMAGGAFAGGQTFSFRSYAGILAERFYAFTAHAPSNTASSTVLQQPTFSNNSITTFGSGTVSASGDWFVDAGVISSRRYDFEVIGQNESVTYQINEHSLPVDSTWNPGLHLLISSPVHGNVNYNFQSNSTLPQTVSFDLAQGRYTLFADYNMMNYFHYVAVPNQPLDSLRLIFEDRISFSNVTFAPGWSEEHPLLPDGTSESFVFTSARSGSWFDPIAANQFEFQMTGDSLFSQIMSFPSGFSAPFEVVVDDVSLGFFEADQSVDFFSLLGHNVSSFIVRNIVPTVDGENPVAFPIMLQFDTPTASFTMTPSFVPEPSTISLMIAAGCSLAAFRRRMRTMRLEPFSDPDPSFRVGT